MQSVLEPSLAAWTGPSPRDLRSRQQPGETADLEEPLLCEAFLHAERWAVAVDLGVERRSHPPQESQEAEELDDATGGGSSDQLGSGGRAQRSGS